jgi:undecaprenyl-diphosphatase
MPFLGLVLVLIGLLVFGAFAIDLVNHGPLVSVDQSLAIQMHQADFTDPPAIVDAIHVSSFWLGREICEGLAVGLSIFLLIKKYWRDFWIIALGGAGGGVVWYTLTRLFNRPRPSFPVSIEHLTDPSFPSGHTLNALIIFGLIAYLLLPYIRSRMGKTLVIVGVLVMVLYVGFGRLFADGHYLTDVLAGYAIGLAWAALVATVVDWWFFRRKLAH